MYMDEGTDCLYACPAWVRLAEQTPRLVREAVGLAISATEEIDQCFLRKMLDRFLSGVQSDLVRKARVAHDTFGEDADVPWRGDDSGAPVAEPVAVGGHRDGGIGAHMIWDHDVGRPRVMSIEHQDHGHPVGARVHHVVSDANFHRALRAPE